MNLFKHTGINEYTIKIVKDKQLSYNSIDAPNLMELETLKAYNKTYQKIKFIWLFKFSAGASIFFYKKFNSSFYIYVNY